MQLLYGEGSRAFTRLQQEMIRVYDDEIIFAWASDNNTRYTIFASSSQASKASGNLVPAQFDEAIAPFYVTDKGLHCEPFCFPEKRRLEGW